ncbi:MAG TPA: HNH endonuclease signature motif containing protein, partial [Terrabacter sp.]|nr:HNH endonuclease signature motif containing protein [Terrabacter sp.]
AQRRALAQRDGGCSYPGCTIPPQWCDAHHVVHWLHGGATDLSNGALLCGRHHIVVHERGLTATVTSFGVTWHS